MFTCPVALTAAFTVADFIEEVTLRIVPKVFDKPTLGWKSPKGSKFLRSWEMLQKYY